MCPQMIFGLAIFALLTLGGRVTAYTNQWAVHIEGGPETAQRVAMDHGFQYLDKVSSKANLTLRNSRKQCLQFKKNLSEDGVQAQLLQRNSDLQEQQKLPKTGILSDSVSVVCPSSRRFSDYIVDQKVPDHKIDSYRHYVKCYADRKSPLKSLKRSFSETTHSLKSDFPACVELSDAITRNGKETKINDYQTYVQDLDVEYFQPRLITSVLSVSNSMRYYTQDVISRQYGSRSTKHSEQWEHYTETRKRQSADCSGNENYAQGQKLPDCSNKVDKCPQQHESLQYNYNETSKSCNQQEHSSEQRHRPTEHNYEDSTRYSTHRKRIPQQEFEPQQQQQSVQCKSDEPIDGSTQPERSTKQQQRSAQCQYDEPSEQLSHQGCHHDQQQQEQQQCAHHQVEMKQQQSRLQQQPLEQQYQQQEQQQCAHHQVEMKQQHSRLQQQPLEQQYQQQEQLQCAHQQAQQQCPHHQQCQQQEQEQCPHHQLHQQQYEHEQQYPPQQEQLQQHQEKQQCPHHQLHQQQDPPQQEQLQQHQEKQQCPHHQLHQQQYPPQQEQLQQHHEKQQQEQQQHCHQQQLQQQSQQQPHQQQCHHHQENQHPAQQQPNQQHGQSCRHSDQQDQQHLAMKCNNPSTSSNQREHCPLEQQSARSTQNKPASTFGEQTNASCHQKPSHTTCNVIQSLPRSKRKLPKPCNRPQAESVRDKIARMCGCNCKKPSPSDSKNAVTFRTCSLMAEGLISRLWKCKSSETPKTNLEAPKCGCCPSRSVSSNESRYYQLPVSPIRWTEKKQAGSRTQACGTEVFIPFRSSIKPKLKQRPPPRRIDLQSLIQDPAKCQRTRTEAKPKSRGFNKEWQESSSSNPCIVRFDDKKSRCFQLPRGGKTGEEVRGEATFAVLGSSSYQKPPGSFKIDDVSDAKPNMSTLKYRLAKCPTVKEMWQHADCQLPKVFPKPVKVPRPIPVTRRKIPQFKASGEWGGQKYPIRLRIYKSKDSLDPSLPKMAEVSRDRSCVDSSMIKAPRFKQTDHDKCKMTCPCSPPPTIPKKNVPTLMKESSPQGQKLKRAKTCLPCPKSRKV